MRSALGSDAICCLLEEQFVKKQTYLTDIDLAILRTMCREIRNKFPKISQPPYINLIREIQNHTAIHESIGMYTIETNIDWKMRVSYINKGQRVRLDFKETVVGRWEAFGKFQVQNLKKVILRAIRKEREIKIKGRTWKLEDVLILISTSKYSIVSD